MSTSESDSGSSGTNSPEPKKRKRGFVNAHKYARNVMRVSKVKGLQHVNSKGKIIEEKKTGDLCR